MQAFEVKKGVHWVGAVDYESRDFHGYSLSPRGTTYNAYLIEDEKNVLIDTVKHGHFSTLKQRIEHIMPLEKIDYIVANHLEPDHAACLAQVIAACKPEKVFCSTMGLRSMQGYFNSADWPVQTVKTGDSISIGKRTIHFVEARMLHWPDSMFSYIPEEKLLFSNDAFGQNIASSERYSDAFDAASITAVIKEYYYNIVLPFSGVVLKTLDAVAAMGLEIDTIAPDHGLLYRGAAVGAVLEQYRELALQKPQKRALVVYDTMWNSTEKMAHGIIEGLEQAGVPARAFSLKNTHHSTVMTALADCGAVIMGSPTHNNGVMPNVAAMLCYMKGLKPQNRIGAAFGSFGWSGESPRQVHDELAAMGMSMPVEALKQSYAPTAETFARCVEFGREIAAALDAACAATA